MRLTITDTNFTTEKPWLFKLKDEFNKHYYIMDSSFYKKHTLDSPLTKRELDYYDRETSITAQVETIEDLSVVVRIN